MPGPKSTAEKVQNTASSIVLDAPRARVTVEIESMARGPAKVTVRVDGDDSDTTAAEAYRVYEETRNKINELEKDT